MLRKLLAALWRVESSANTVADTLDEANEKFRRGLGLDDPKLTEYVVDAKVVPAITAKKKTRKKVSA